MLAIVSAAAPSTACAADGAPEFKLTAGVYRTSARVDSLDLNLRARTGLHTGWVGWYTDSDDVREPRAGYEFTPDWGWLRPNLSLQIASGGFRGWSLTSEVGPQPLFAIVGGGRTNLRPYVNLNFDPNDMIQYGIGTRPDDHLALALFRIQDDRLETGQKVTHAVARMALRDDLRIVLDLFHKSGDTDAGRRVVGNGVSVTVEVAGWFVRVASDPYVNFTDDRMTRVSVGARF